MQLGEKNSPGHHILTSFNEKLSKYNEREKGLISMLILILYTFYHLIGSITYLYTFILSFYQYLNRIGFEQIIHFYNLVNNF